MLIIKSYKTVLSVHHEKVLQSRMGSDRVVQNTLLYKKSPRDLIFIGRCGCNPASKSKIRKKFPKNFIFSFLKGRTGTSRYLLSRTFMNAQFCIICRLTFLYNPNQSPSVAHKTIVFRRSEKPNGWIETLAAKYSFLFFQWPWCYSIISLRSCNRL